MKLELAPEAEADLRDIGDYIAEDSRGQASKFVQELQSACFGLLEAPLRFALLENFARLGYRRRVHGRYAIVYVVRGDVVSVIRIVSTAQDIEAVLASD